MPLHDQRCTGCLADVQTAAWKVFTTWGCAMPVAAAQLVLATAAEDGALVSSFGFASKLPLAASGAYALPCPSSLVEAAALVLDSKYTGAAAISV